MKFLSNLHTHSTFSDGKSTMEEIILTAIEKNFISIGFSDHSYAPEAYSYCMDKEMIIPYIDSINKLKLKYSEKIEIYTGIEWDYYTPNNIYDNINFDYKIAAVHFFRDKNNNLYDVDYTPEIFQDAVINLGGIENTIKNYYNSLGELISRDKFDIIAHLDLIQKNNKNNMFFNENDGWYQDILDDILREIKNQNCIIEINTGGIYRGYMKAPYPSEIILKKISDLNIPVTINSDSHINTSIDFYFDEAIKLLKKLGFRNIKILKSNNFMNIEI